MMRTHSLIAPLLLLTMLFLSGCGAVIVGTTAAAGTYVYVDGQAQGSYAATLDETFAAVRLACRDLAIPITREVRDTTSASFRGKLGDDPIFISLETQDRTLTRVTVRVGYFGSRDAAGRIHSAISQRL